jgi:hypothetical protein
MNRKQLVILLVLVVVLGGAGLVIHNKQNQERQGGDPSAGKKLLGDFPVNDVARITLKQGTNEATLVKKDDLWRVGERNDYPASFTDISDFLLKTRDLKIVQSEQVGASQLGRLELAAGQGSNSALVVEFDDQHDKPIKTLLLGKKHMKKTSQPSQFGEGDEGWPDGRYVKTGDSADVAIISNPLDNIEPQPAQWLDKNFFKVEKAKTIAVAFPNATNSWKLTRETESGDWKLADAKADEQLDSAKTSGVSNPFSSPSFADVSTSAKPEEIAAGKPTVVTIDTFDNFSYTVKVGGKTNDDYQLTVAVTAQIPKERTPGKDEKPEDKTKLDKEFKDHQQNLEEKLNQEKGFGKWVYLVSNWVVEPVLKERAQLLVEKKEEPKKEEAKKDVKAAADADAGVKAEEP